MEDPNYFLQKENIKKDSIIYIFIQDLPIFVNLVFIHLPEDYKITLVTGMDDFGAPFEIFSPSGRFKVKPPIEMRKVLQFNIISIRTVLFNLCVVFSYD